MIYLIYVITFWSTSPMPPTYYGPLVGIDSSYEAYCQQTLTESMQPGAMLIDDDEGYLICADAML